MFAKSVYRILFLLLISLVLISCRKSPPPPLARNIVLISMDSVRADHVGRYGAKNPTTPRLDEISRQGTFFQTDVSASCWTLPSHMSMLTGLVPELHGVTPRDPLDRARPIISEMLKQAGLQTAGFVSSPYLDSRYGFSRGFEVYKNFWSAVNQKNAGPETADIDETGPLVAKSGMNWLDAHSKDRFFLFLHFWDAHYDYVPPAPYNTKFVKPGYVPTLSMTGYFLNPKIVPGIAPEDLEYVLSQYDGEIAFVDGLIGGIVKHLGDLGLADNTLLIITADHGDEFFEHGHKGHRKTLYDEVLLVPLIVRGPGIQPKPAGIPQQVSSIDLAPTILAAAGVRPDPVMMGRNLLPLLTQLNGDAPEVSGAQSLHPAPYAISQFKEQFSLRLPKWKGIDDPNKNLLKFFDLSRDPHETASLDTLTDSEAQKLKNDLYRFRSELQKAAAKQKKFGTNPVSVDEEEAERMRAIGYTDD